VVHLGQHGRDHSPEIRAARVRAAVMSDRPRVAVIFTGGTIDSVGRDRLDVAWYIENASRLSDEDVLARVGELDSIARVLPVPFRKVPSHALTLGDWLQLGSTIQGVFDRNEADGVVVTHGTSTLEETAYFLHLTLKSEQPVVLVGAMRPPSALGSDSDRNLLNAVSVAASRDAHGCGVLVVMNDAIFSARDATKTSTYRLQSMQARDSGPLGYADVDGQVVRYQKPTRRHTSATEFDIMKLTHLPRVDVVLSYVDADGCMIDAAVGAGAEGIVMAAAGAGRPTPLEDAALSRAQDRGVVICIGSRIGSGRVVRSPQFRERRLVVADNLVAWKARALLALALTVTRDPDTVQEMFDRY